MRRATGISEYEYKTLTHNREQKHPSIHDNYSKTIWYFATNVMYTNETILTANNITILLQDLRII